MNGIKFTLVPLAVLSLLFAGVQLTTAADELAPCSATCLPSEICVVNKPCRVDCDLDCTQGTGEKDSNCINMCGPCGVHC